MLKGCAKRVVYMKNTDSDMFEEAYFIIRAGQVRSDATEKEMVVEAERIIRESSCNGAGERRRVRGTLLYLMGALSATFFYTVLGVVIFYACR